MATFREIEFENNQPKVCYSGQLIRGRVNVYFPVDTHVTGDDMEYHLCHMSCVYISISFTSNLYYIFWSWILSLDERHSWKRDYWFENLFRCTIGSHTGEGKRFVLL